MNRRSFLGIILSFSLLFSLIGCSKYKIDKDFCENSEYYINMCWAEVNKIISNYYPNCTLTASPYNEKNMKNGFYYREEYSTIISENTKVNIEIMFDCNSKKQDKFFTVEMERDFDGISHNGFNENSLNLFCDLSNIVSDGGLKISICDALIRNDEKYNYKFDDDSFVPIDKYVRTYSGYNLYYKIIDYKAGNWENRNYCEVISSVFEIN